MAEQLSAEAQAMVDEGMQLATLFGETYESMNRSKNSRELDRRIATSSDAAFALRAHLERMASLAAPQGEPVASIYIDLNGKREIDDWRIELPAGQTILYTAPQAQPAREPMSVERIDELAHQQGDYDEKHGCWSFNADPDCRYNLVNLVRTIEHEHGITQGEQP